MAEKFTTYWHQLDSTQQEKVKEDLIRNLDDESIKQVENFINRQIYIAHHEIISLGNLFTKEELREQKECSREIRLLTKDLSRYNFNYLASECFYGISGLRWLPQHITERLKGGVFVDAGAYEGDTAIFLSMKYHPNHVYAFEPEANNFAVLENNFSIAQTSVLLGINKGLSDTNLTADMIKDGSQSRLGNGESAQQSQFVCLDNWAKGLKPSRDISLIKMDVEGAERLALRGCEQIIREQHPILAISIYHGPEDFFLIKPWLEQICPDYKFIIKKATPYSLTGETMLLAYVD